jgi:hypothetical protein
VKAAFNDDGGSFRPENSLENLEEPLFVDWPNCAESDRRFYFFADAVIDAKDIPKDRFRDFGNRGANKIDGDAVLRNATPRRSVTSSRDWCRRLVAYENPIAVKETAFFGRGC